MWSKDFKLSGILSEVLSDEDCVRRVAYKISNVSNYVKNFISNKNFQEIFIRLGCQQRHYEPVFLSGQPG